MKTVLVYDHPRLARNSEFVRLIFEKFEARGLKIELKLLEEWNLETDPDRPEAVLMRATDAAFSHKLESYGIRVFNSAHVSEICNDKWKTYEFFNTRGVPMLPTFRLESGGKPSEISYPFVLKSPTGHGGTEVFLIHDDSELAQFANFPQIAQPLCDAPGRDLRVYCVGNQIVGGMLRTSDVDFRSNYSLGGQAVWHELTPEERFLILRVLSLINFDFVGIDLIYHENRPILNEIEDVVGSRMLYRETKIDILDLFLDYFETCFPHNSC